MWLTIFVVYFLPALVAKYRRHHQFAAICLTNLLLGWTVLGLIVALIWSATATTRSSRQQSSEVAVNAQPFRSLFGELRVRHSHPSGWIGHFHHMDKGAREHLRQYPLPAE
jgi:hypothetical protein